MNQQIIFFDTEIKDARAHASRGDIEAAWTALENAHIIGQTRPLLHFRSHWHMLRFAVETRAWHEVSGQLLRLVFALPTAALGAAPIGNTGRTRDGHSPMPIPSRLHAKLAACGLLILALVLGGCAATPTAHDAGVKLRGERGWVLPTTTSDGALAVRALSPDGTPLTCTVLSRAAERTEPVITPEREGARIAWAERDGDDSAWRVRVVTWVPGTPARPVNDAMVRVSASR